MSQNQKQPCGCCVRPRVRPATGRDESAFWHSSLLQDLLSAVWNQKMIWLSRLECQKQRSSAAPERQWREQVDRPLLQYVLVGAQSAPWRALAVRRRHIQLYEGSMVEVTGATLVARYNGEYRFSAPDCCWRNADRRLARPSFVCRFGYTSGDKSGGASIHWRELSITLHVHPTAGGFLELRSGIADVMGCFAGMLVGERVII